MSLPISNNTLILCVLALDGIHPGDIGAGQDVYDELQEALNEIKELYIERSNLDNSLPSIDELLSDDDI